MPAWRLVRRLAWRLAAVMVIAMVLAAGGVAWRTLATIRSLDDAALQSQARLVASHLSTGPDGKPRLDLSDQLGAAFRGTDAQSLFVIYDAAGKVLFTSDANAAAALAPYRPRDPGFFRVPPADAYPEGVLGVLVRDGSWRVVVAQAHEQQEGLVESLLREFLFSALWLLVPMALVTVGIAVFTVRHGLRPLREASAAAARVGPGHPHVRLPTSGLPGELSPLVGAVNAALDRMERSLEAHRRFVGDAAHALRTPLAILIARIDELPEGPETAALRADCDRMRRLLEQMLTMARLDGAPLDVSAAIDLRAAAAEAIAGRAPLAIGRGIELALNAPDDLPPIEGNRAAVVLAVENLLDNAIAHAPFGSSVEVEINPPATLSVLDRGPGVAAEKRGEIFRRFHTGRSRGVGLGLAIVAEVAAAHGASIRYEPRAGGGSAFVLRFTRLAPPPTPASARSAWPAAGFRGAASSTPARPPGARQPAATADAPSDDADGPPTARQTSDPSPSSSR
jgi:two-component system, OmpR family, sensor histidine kinase TctE